MGEPLRSRTGPERARIAVQFVVNYEEGGENNILAWRRRVRGVPVRDRRRRALAGHASHEHGIDLRIWLPRRLLAPAPHVHRALGSGHRLCGGDGDGAQSRGGRGDERGRGGRSPLTAQVDRLSRHAARDRGAPYRRGGAHPHRNRRRSAARLLPRPLVDQHDPARHGRGRVRLLRRFLCRRFALLASKDRAARSS